MAAEDEVVTAEITEVVETSETRAPPWRPGQESLGYVTVESPWGNHILVSGTTQGVPSKYRKVGQRVELRWDTCGSYHGPMFSGAA